MKPSCRGYWALSQTWAIVMHLCVCWRFIMSWLCTFHQNWNKSWTVFSIFDLWKAWAEPWLTSQLWNRPSFVGDFFSACWSGHFHVSFSVTDLFRLNSNSVCRSPHGVGLFFRSLYRENKSGQKQQGCVWNRLCICAVLYFGPVADYKISLWANNSVYVQQGYLVL